MEWTPEAIKAEMDYRQKAMCEEARRVELYYREGHRQPSWWHRITHRTT